MTKVQGKDNAFQSELYLHVSRREPKGFLQCEVGDIWQGRTMREAQAVPVQL